MTLSANINKKKWPQADASLEISSGLDSRFAVTAGSLLGREHARIGKNNQDAVFVESRKELVLAVVCDGCSAGRFSEVGARLAAAWLARHIPTYAANISLERLPVALSKGLGHFLRRLALQLSTQLADLPGIVRDYLLFTFMVAIVTEDRTIIFGLGDGLFSVNGHVTVLEPGEGNAPNYLAYGLIPDQLTRRPESLVPEIYFSAPSQRLDSILIATDGVADLIAAAGQELNRSDLVEGIRPFEKQERYQRNPSLLQKRLNQISAAGIPLFDDTTIALIRRRSTTEEKKR
jgi:serine/threonine protein phosphatase PrpC